VNTANSVKYRYAKKKTKGIISASFVGDIMVEKPDMTEEAAKKLLREYLDTRLGADKSMYGLDQEILLVDGQEVTPLDIQKAYELVLE